jgi:hypothetical protein
MSHSLVPPDRQTTTHDPPRMEPPAGVRCPLPALPDERMRFDNLTGTCAAPWPRRDARWPLCWTNACDSRNFWRTCRPTSSASAPTRSIRRSSPPCGASWNSWTWIAAVSCTTRRTSDNHRSRIPTRRRAFRQSRTPTWTTCSPGTRSRSARDGCSASAVCPMNCLRRPSASGSSASARG